MTGPRLVALAGLVVAGLVGAILATNDPGEPELRAAIRVTAFTSVLLFLAAYLASPLARLRPSPAARWLLANRRYLGLSFATSHALHAATIAAMHARSGLLTGYDPTTLVFGGGGFVVIALLAATSNDAAVRLLGRWWNRLHAVGIHYLWFIFLFTYMGPAPGSPFHAAMTLALVGALLARLAARRA